VVVQPAKDMRIEQLLCWEWYDSHRAYIWVKRRRKTRMHQHTLQQF